MAAGKFTLGTLRKYSVAGAQWIKNVPPIDNTTVDQNLKRFHLLLNFSYKLLARVKLELTSPNKLCSNLNIYRALINIMLISWNMNPIAMFWLMLIGIYLPRVIYVCALV